MSNTLLTRRIPLVVVTLGLVALTACTSESLDTPEDSSESAADELKLAPIGNGNKLKIPQQRALSEKACRNNGGEVLTGGAVEPADRKACTKRGFSGSLCALPGGALCPVATQPLQAAIGGCPSGFNGVPSVVLVCVK